MGKSELPTRCALCGQDPAGGQAMVYDGDKKIRLCHDDGPVETDDERTCYQKWRPSAELVVNQGFCNANHRENDD